MTMWESGLAGVVTPPDGCCIRGRALRDDGPPDEELPELGLYLTARSHTEAWESRWVRWPDFRQPSAPSDAIAHLRAVDERLSDTTVEVACGGGRGTAATAIALLIPGGGCRVERGLL